MNQMKTNQPLVIVAVLLLGGILVVGCSQNETAPKTSATSADSAKSVDGSKYLLASEPDGAKDVIQVRNDAKDQAEIVVVGRIGGGENPWIDGRAAFTIVDPSLKACSDIPGDKCETPWDYCCQTSKLPKSTAFIKVVDETGNIIKADARKLLKVKELQTVVVRGKAQRDESGNLTVIATGVFVRK